MLRGKILLGSSQNTHFSSVVGLWVYFSFTFKFLHVFYNEYVLQLEWRKNNLHINKRKPRLPWLPLLFRKTQAPSPTCTCFPPAHAPSFWPHGGPSYSQHLPSTLYLSAFTHTTVCLPFVSCWEVGSERAWPLSTQSLL